MKLQEYKMFAFEPEISWYFPAGRSEKLPGNFRLPALLSTLAIVK